MNTSDRSHQETRPTLQQLRRATSLTSRQLAEVAGVPLRIEYLMEIGGQVDLEDALKILDALTQLTGHTYSLEKVEVNLAHEITPLPGTTPPEPDEALPNTTTRKAHLWS